MSTCRILIELSSYSTLNSAHLCIVSQKHFPCESIDKNLGLDNVFCGIKYSGSRTFPFQDAWLVPDFSFVMR